MNIKLNTHTKRSKNLYTLYREGGWSDGSQNRALNNQLHHESGIQRKLKVKRQ